MWHAATHMDVAAEHDLARLPMDAESWALVILAGPPDNFEEALANLLLPSPPLFVM